MQVVQRKVAFAFLLFAMLVTPWHIAEADSDKRPLAITDIMKFREIERQVWSTDGAVYAFDAVPDRGDATGYVVRVEDMTQFEVERGTHPQITDSGRFVAFRQAPRLLDTERATNAEERAALKTNTVLVDTQSGEQRVFENVRSFAFTGHGETLVLMHEKERDEQGHLVRLIDLRSSDLASATKRDVTGVELYSVAATGPRVAFHLAASDEQPGQIIVRNTENHSWLRLLDNVGKASAKLSFNEAGDALAIAAGTVDSKKDASSREIWVWQFGHREPQALAFEQDGWAVNEHSALAWHANDQALLAGIREVKADEQDSLGQPETEADLYDLERLLSDRRLQVWHGEDDRIIPHQRESHAQRSRATVPVIYWFEQEQWTVLADSTEVNLRIEEDMKYALASDARPYLREITWAGFFHDLYHVDLKSGAHQLIASRLPSSERGSLSPNGRYVAYVQDEQLHVFDRDTGAAQVHAEHVGVSWVNELEDRPTQPGAYGTAGWLADSSGFYQYDRFDIWQVMLAGSARNVTAGWGREHTTQLRIQAKSEGHLQAQEPLLVRSFNEQDKTSGFHRVDPEQASLQTLIAGEKTYQLVKRFDEHQRLFFTEQDFRQFPDVQVADLNFNQPQRLTDINPQISEFKWGNASLIEWQSALDEPLQGVVIKPDNYDPNRRYPVMVYFYEKFSQRLYQFNQMKVNHRPNFPFYVGQDYVVFLPDVNFRIPAPGPSATESLVPGVQKLIDLGIADPDAIGLHGHSWSGYQAAFTVTETDIFTAVVSGAPVSNMTSAYSGIRWGSGLARQFQYEVGQSRIGESMYENLEPYIKNSPVFFADRINTPMLIQFGDKDEAVPWEQGIEYYLALRRLDKPVVMLHYEGEPHHLRRYANKIDYTVKMLEFFDHFLKGAEAPEWWTEGLEFQVYD